MLFAAPLFLLTLIPFAAFALWLCFGRRKRTPVPFLQLWDAPEELRRPKKGLEMPPIAIILALLALLCGLLALSRPQLRRDRAELTVIVDRGATMSAMINGKSRFAHAAEMLRPLARDADIQVIDLLDSNRISAALHEIAQWKRTALDTSTRSAIRAARERGLPVIVLSDHPPATPDDRVIHVAPDQPVNNAGITHIAFNKSQVMVTLRANFTGQRTVELLAANTAHKQTIDLAPNAERKLFFDLPNPPDIIEARLAPPDDFDGDDVAYLVRRASWPIVEPRTALPEEIRRVLQAYARHRPTSPSSSIVSIARDSDANIILPQLAVDSPLGKLDIKAHPVTDGIDWSALTSAAIAEKPPGEGWTILLSAGGKPLLAVRDTTRQIWLGFSSRPFAQSPAFVSLWTNILDWAGRGGDEFAYDHITPDIAAAKRIEPTVLPPDVDIAHWPGVFATSTGHFAANATFIEPKPQSTNWRDRLAALDLSARAALDLSPHLALAALALLAAAALTWPFPRRIASVSDEQNPPEMQSASHRHETQISKDSFS